MTTEPLFWHEKLDVYNLALAFASRSEAWIQGCPREIAAADHLGRAAESVLENIVNANASWSRTSRRQSLGVACGSALECAACLDIFRIKRLIAPELCHAEKSELRRIVQMLVRLHQSQHSAVREAEDVICGTQPSTHLFFDHERLDVYQLALAFVAWADQLAHDGNVSLRRINRLDELSTSVVLNIAEGNGRFKEFDHRQFIEIARQSALKSVVVVDLMMAKKEVESERGRSAKDMLSRMVKMLLGMRGYLEGQGEG